MSEHTKKTYYPFMLPFFFQMQPCMNVLFWNCRGLGNSRTVQELCGFVQSYSPKLVFLSETRMHTSRARNLSWCLGLSRSLAISSVGLSGGLVLFWDESINVTLLYQGERALDVLVNESSGGSPWRTTFVYGGEPVRSQRSPRVASSWVILCIWDE